MVCLTNYNGIIGCFAGHLLAHVSWTCPQSNPEIRVSGYKVLVDGKQYGTTLHAGVKNVRIKVRIVCFLFFSFSYLKRIKM